MSLALQPPLLARLRALLVAGDRPLRFVAAGAVNTVVGLALYPFLLWWVPVLRQHYMIALLLAQGLCLVFAYFMYKITVFRTHANSLKEFGMFSSFYVITACLNWVVLPLLVEHVRVAPAIAQTGFSLFLMVSSYFWHSRLTFRTKMRQS